MPKIARDRQLLLELITEEIVLAIGDGSEGAQGIVFCQTRRQVEEMADGLRPWAASASNIAVGAHHSGLSQSARRKVERSWQRGDLPVLVATSGMGLGQDLGGISFGPALPGQLSGLGISHSKSVLYGAFVWARRALNIQKRLGQSSTAMLHQRSAITGSKSGALAGRGSRHAAHFSSVGPGPPGAFKWP